MNWRQDQCFSSLMKFLFQVLGKNVKGSIPSQFSCIEVCRMLGNFPHLLPSHFYFFISLFASLCPSVSFSSSFNYWHMAPCTVIFAFPWYVSFFFFFLKTLMYLSVWPTVWILLNLPCSAPLQFFHSLFSCSVLHLNLFQPTLYCSHAAWYLSWRSFCWLILRKSLFQMFLFSASLFLIFNENTLIYLSGWLKRKYQFYLL